MKSQLRLRNSYRKYIQRSRWSDVPVHPPYLLETMHAHPNTGTPGLSRSVPILSVFRVPLHRRAESGAVVSANQRNAGVHPDDHPQGECLLFSLHLCVRVRS